MLWDVLILASVDTQIRLSGRVLMLAQIGFKNEKDRQSSRRWLTCQDVLRPVPFHSQLALVKPSPLLPRICPDIEAPMPDC
jgi:hypothetical protein